MFIGNEDFKELDLGEMIMKKFLENLIEKTTSLFGDIEMLSPKQQKFLLRQLKDILNAAVKHQSHVSVVCHNHVFDPLEFPLLNRLYGKILKFTYRQQALRFSTDELYLYWIER